MPALALALGCLIALSRHAESRATRGHLALAAAAGRGACPASRSSSARSCCSGSAPRSCSRAARRASRSLVVAAPAALATALLALGQGGETVAVRLAPLDLVRVTRETLGLDPLHGAALVGAALVWLALSLGLRPSACPRRFARCAGPQVASALAAMALAGWPLGLLLRVSAPEVLAGQKVVNDAGLPRRAVRAAALGLRRDRPGALRDHRARAARSPWRRLLLFAAARHPAVRRSRRPRTAPDRMPAPMVRAMDALATAVAARATSCCSGPGGRYPPAPVVLAGRRVTYERFTPYLTQFVAKADLEARHECVFRFFRTGRTRRGAADRAAPRRARTSRSTGATA